MSIQVTPKKIEYERFDIEKNPFGWVSFIRVSVQDDDGESVTDINSKKECDEFIKILLDARTILWGTDDHEKEKI